MIGFLYEEMASNKNTKSAKGKPSRTTAVKPSKKPVKTYEGLNKIYQGLIAQEQKINDKIFPLEDRFYNLRSQLNQFLELYSYKKNWEQRAEKIISSMGNLIDKIQPLDSQRKPLRTKINAIWREMQSLTPPCGGCNNAHNAVPRAARAGRLR